MTTTNNMRPSRMTSAHQQVVSANVELYREIAEKYDRYEVCVRDRDLQLMLDRDLSRIESLSRVSSLELKCLDCGRGSGNLSLKMLAKGWDVTVVDVSSEMLDILGRKAQAKGFAPKLVHASIENYLGITRESYHVISFSSALHHLYSYLSVVELAAACIQQGGIFYSVFDPVPSRSKWLQSLFEAVDTTCSKAFHDPHPCEGRW